MPGLASPEALRKPLTTVAEEMTLGEARAAGRAALRATSASPGLDADLLLEHLTGLPRTMLITSADQPLSRQQARDYRALIQRRVGGEPLAYIVGRKAFRTLELRVDSRVLVPRPETELLVEIGLVAARCLPGEIHIVDVGTGSGAVAFALATELPPEDRQRIRITACDISQEALDLAAENRHALGIVERVQLVRSNLLEGVEGTFDLVLANLPYLRDDQRHPSTRAEPELALYAGTDGLDLYRELFCQLPGRLTARDLLACEIDPAQSAAMVGLTEHHVGGATAVLPDLAGDDRFVICGDVDIVRTVAETWSYGA